MSAWLEPESGRTIRFDDRCTLGRLPENTVALVGSRVSRWHAVIQRAADNAWWLLDLGSSNGVALNGVRLHEPAELADTDQIEIGGHHFTFHTSAGRISQRARDQMLAESIRQRTERPQEAFTPVEQAAVIINPAGQIKFLSPRAQEMLQTYFAAGTADALPARLQKWMTSQAQAGASLQTAAMLGDPLVVAHGDRRLQVRLVESDATQKILLLIEEQQAFAPEQLERLGLTRRESEVLHWLAEGKTNPEIATILGGSPATVKKHVEHIFAKLGVDNRSSALLRVLELRMSQFSAMPRRL
ncbi:MAG: FHA domain-containing protein [Verrucomicrobia bacterium]|nr:FHA domain-containing protein [Verrucomicrobiota bacterium]